MSNKDFFNGDFFCGDERTKIIVKRDKKFLAKTLWQVLVVMCVVSVAVVQTGFATDYVIDGTGGASPNYATLQDLQDLQATHAITLNDGDSITFTADATTPDNTLTGAFTLLSGGTLKLDSAKAITIGPATASGAEQFLAFNDDGGLTVNAGANLTIDGFVNSAAISGYVLGSLATVDTVNPTTPCDFTLTNSGALTLKNNKADGSTTNVGTGGAISSTGKIIINNTGTLTFDGNEATGTGGFGGALAAVENITISGNGTHTFSSNKATTNGGAIFSQSGHVSITSGTGSATFNGNQAGTAGLNASGGGAIYASQVTLTKLSTGNITFTSNQAGEFGGAILIHNTYAATPPTSIVNIDGATFGGASAGNEATKRGGAIYLVNTDTTAASNVIKNSLFEGNKVTAGADNQDGGGAIYTKSALTIIDTNFKDNTVTGTNAQGGAIYAEKALVIKAETADVTFSGNKVNGIANDIHLAGADASATFNAASNLTIKLESGISGGGAVVKTNAGTLTLGATSINTLGDITVSGGVLEVIQGAKFTAPPTKLELSNNSIFRVTGVNSASVGGDSAPLPITLGTGGGTLDVKTTSGHYDLTLIAGGSITGDNKLTITNSATSNTSNLGKLILASGTTNTLGALEIGTNAALENKGALNVTSVTVTGAKSLLNLAATSTNNISGAISVSNGGVFEVANGASLGTSVVPTGIALNNGTLKLTGTGITGIEASVPLTLAGTTATLEVTDVGGVGAIRGIVSGAGKLTKTGAGALTLDGNNTYTGGTEIKAGTVEVGNNKAFGAGTVTLAGAATIQKNAGSGIGAISLANYIDNDGHLLTVHNGDTLNAANTLTFSGIIYGDGGLTKTGAGKVVLSGGNAYTGATTITAGTLSIGSSLEVTAEKTQTAAPISILSGATLEVATNGTLVVKVKATELTEVSTTGTDFYFADTTSGGSVIAASENLDYSSINSFLYKTTYQEDTAYLTVAKKSAGDLRYVSRSVAESFAKYTPGNNSFFDNVIKKSTGNEYTDAERLELGYNLAAAAGMGAQVASVGELFRGGMRQQIAGRAYLAPLGRTRGGVPQNQMRSYPQNRTQNYPQSSARSTVRGQCAQPIPFAYYPAERTLWVAPMYGHQQASGLYSGGIKHGYSSDQYGAAFGMESSQGRVKFGVAAQLGGGSTTSAQTAVVRTQNASFFGGLGIYHSMPTAFGEVGAQLGWIGTRNKIKQSNAGAALAATASGGSVFYSLGLEKKRYFGNAYFTPLLGLDYGYVYQSGFNTTGAGGAVFHTESAGAHLLTLPVGMRCGYDYNNLRPGGYGFFTPEFSARFLPNVGNSEFAYNVTPAGATAAQLRSFVSDQMAGDLAFGLNWRGRITEAGFRYGVLFSEHFTNQELNFSWRTRY